MRILGIDYGTKRMGLAISDESETIAFSYGIVEMKAGYLASIERLLETEDIGEVVIGISKNSNGQDNALEIPRKEFVSELKKKVSVFEIDERLTSHEARLREFGNDTRSERKEKKNTKDHIDAEAAQILLQRYLDKKKSSNTSSTQQ